MNEEYLAELVKYITKKKPTKKSLNSFKVRLCKKHKLGKIPKDIDILLALSPKDLKRVKKYLITKPVRSLSGVTVVAMMAAPRKCAHGTCTFCPGGPGSVFGDVPQSYTGKEPSTMRALRNKFDSYYIMMNRLEQYICAGHLPDKVEIIIQGGTFPSYPRKYQRDYVTYALKALNDFSRIFFPKKLKGEIDFAKFKKFFALPGDIYDKKREALLFKRWKKIRGKSTLEREQLRNEKARLKCVGLTIETNPQYARLAHGNMMLSLGCTRVELGVQTLYDKVLRKTNRGHGLQGTIEAIHILRDLGFKLNFHMMLGLPGVTKSMDLRALIKLFHDEDYRPDMLKIYPCMVMPGTKLFKEWKKGKFKPINTKQSAELIARFKEYCPEYCRIMRVQRDIPTHITSAGVDRTNLRQYVEVQLKKRKITCSCIRCREIGRSPSPKIIKKVSYVVSQYNAANGNEFFIEALSGNALVGFCRLRFPGKYLRKEIEDDGALIRELHVFGEAVELGKKGSKSMAQHRGIGKRLMQMAEHYAKQYLKRKMVVISAIGTREYYRKLGYRKQGVYMVKRLEG